MALQLPVPPRDRLPKEAGNEHEEKVEPKELVQGKGTPLSSQFKRSGELQGHASVSCPACKMELKLLGKASVCQCCAGNLFSLS